MLIGYDFNVMYQYEVSEGKQHASTYYYYYYYYCLTH
jgi:hypothetical protein